MENQLEFDFGGTITGGKEGGKLLDSVEDPEFRDIGFKEIQTPVGEGGQTWVIIHGWNSDPDADNIAYLIEKVAQKADSSDRILALDWREASNNGNFISGGNGIAATWIAPTAEFVVQTLEQQYGIDSVSASQDLNLIGHSLGSLVSSEIGQIYKNGANRAGEPIIEANSKGVATITALDPAAETNLRPDLIFKEESGYDVDGRVEGRQTPADFNDSAVFSRSFIGRRSVSGNPLFADSADEAYELDFGNLIDNPFDSVNSEHGRVVKTFANLIDRPGKIGELLGYDSYQSLDTLPVLDFQDLNLTRRLRSRTYQGIINVDNTNQPTLLTADSAVNDNGKIIIGEYLPDIIDGGIGDDRLFGEDNNDTLTGKLGDDILVGGAGDDRLIGDDSINVGDDLLYGGTGKDFLTGDRGADTFVFQAGDGNSDRDSTNLITDFEVGVDRIGLIDVDAAELTLTGDTVDSAIELGGEYLAVIEEVSLNELLDANQESTLYSSVDEAAFDLV